MVVASFSDPENVVRRSNYFSKSIVTYLSIACFNDL